MILAKTWHGKTVRISADGRVNLNDMAVACGYTTEHVKGWLKSETTKNLICHYENSPTLIKGGEKTPQLAIQTVVGREGRWAVRVIAIAYAMNLSPEFYLQVCLWIDELLTKGTVSISDDPVAFLRHLKGSVSKVGRILWTENRVHHLYFAEAVRDIGRGLYRQAQAYITTDYADQHISEYQEVLRTPQLPFSDEEGAA